MAADVRRHVTSPLVAEVTLIAVRTYRQTLLLAPTSSPSRFPVLQVERVRN